MKRNAPVERIRRRNMAGGFQRQWLTVHSHKTLATVGLLLALLAVPMLGGTAIAGGSDEPHIQSKLAPLLNEKAPNRIPDQYIVIFKPGTPRNVLLSAQKKIKGLRSTVRTTYDTSGLIGFSAELSKSALQTMRANPSVDYIEVDQVGSLNSIQPPDPPFPPPPGLDRVSERFLPLNSRYTYSESGAGVHVYVIDTGIHAGHTEFGGRVSGGTNTMDNAAGTDDCHGHGTHVAGIIGGATVGIAKQVFLHPVRAGDCNGTSLSTVIDAVNWVTANRIRPAVVNLSSTFAISPTLNTAVINSINSPSLVTYVVAAGNSDAPACNFSPAQVPAAITVGAIDPTNDTRMNETVVINGISVQWISNYGTCLDLFAPGTQILSAMPDIGLMPGCSLVSNTPGSRIQSCSGTSMATPHVAGVAARYLQTHPMATPADVWNAIHNANNVPTTAGWTGVIDPGAGSPNEMLHYGSLNDGYNDGDPHITTVNGIHYDFQNGGEFVSLRDANGMEIQTRQTPVATAPWVSVNTAIAARVGKHRLTWQPGPSGLQLRVDGALTTISANGLDLGDGGRVMKSVDVDGLEIRFPDGTLLIVTSHWWEGQSQWYLNVHVFHTPATEGIMGAIEQDSWLKLGFPETWRVTDKTSLFDYTTGQSTKTFTFPSFPTENIQPVKPENEALAKRACDRITDKDMLKDCLFDVAVTGDPIFGKSTRIQQQIQRGATSTTVSDDKDPARIGEQVTFTATVALHEQGDVIPTGEVMFLLDGKPVGKPSRLDSSGRARWMTRHIMVGKHRVAASYIPDKDSVFLPSRSLDEQHIVKKRGTPHRRISPKAR
jgi:hypothetical protein